MSVEYRKDGHGRTIDQIERRGDEVIIRDEKGYIKTRAKREGNQWVTRRGFYGDVVSRESYHGDQRAADAKDRKEVSIFGWGVLIFLVYQLLKWIYLTCVAYTTDFFVWISLWPIWSWFS